MTNYTFSVVATNSIGSGEAGVVNYTTSGKCTMCPIIRCTSSIIFKLDICGRKRPGFLCP